jgi:hypothetical protein
MVRSNGLSGQVDDMKGCRTRARGGALKTPTMVANVTQNRCDELVEPGRDQVATMSSARSVSGVRPRGAHRCSRRGHLAARIRLRRTICSPSAGRSVGSPRTCDRLLADVLFAMLCGSTFHHLQSAANG